MGHGRPHLGSTGKVVAQLPKEGGRLLGQQAGLGSMGWRGRGVSVHGVEVLCNLIKLFSDKDIKSGGIARSAVQARLKDSSLPWHRKGAVHDNYIHEPNLRLTPVGC